MDSLNSLLEEKITIGEDLINKLTLIENINGVPKLKRKIQQELKFLKKKRLTNTIKKENLQCTNLTHFTALVNVLLQVNRCISVERVFMYNDKKLSVDIVCDDGLTWIKVIARNSRSLSQIIAGDASYGVRSIVDHALDYKECAQANLCFYKVPKVIFYFTNEIENDLKLELCSVGITVKTDLDVTELTEELSDASISNKDNIDFKINLKEFEHIKKLNLDVSCMIAYVSSLTNGGFKFIFKEPLLTEQAKWEAKRPVKPILDNLFQDKELYCCETSYKDFQTILNIVGGSQERLRAQDLLSKVTILPDDTTLTETSNSVVTTQNKVLEIGGRIKERSRLIFEFGDRIKAVTVSANEGFIRAAKQQGVDFAVFIHESRALTEQKEATAQSF